MKAITNMAKDTSEEDTKKSKSSERSKKKRAKKKRSKSRVSKDYRHQSGTNTNEQARDERLELEGKCDAQGERSKSIVPIKLSVGVESNGSNCGGWSWGAAFAAASKIQPSETDLDGEISMSSGGNVEEGLPGISRLVNDHKIQTSSKYEQKGPFISSECKLKRKRLESSSGSHDEDCDLSESSDLSLEGRMVPISPTNDTGNMSLVLVHKQSGKVYSSGARKKDGRRLVIGKIVEGNVELDPSAVEKMTRLEDGDISSPLKDSAQGSPKEGPLFPYPTNPDDHCETGLTSYKDILPILIELCKILGKDKHSMEIYDPYFCDGSVIKHLSSLGFSSVYNKREDCYEVWSGNSEPPFEVFVTNPPYSEDHIEKLMKHVTSPSFSNRPWLLLMPQWVHKKDYYADATTKNRFNPCNPFYIVPKRRYVYLPPANFRKKKDSDTHKKSSPFVSMWYCWGGNAKRNEKLIQAFQNSDVVGDCDLARSKSSLRDLRRSGSNKNKKSKKSKGN